MQSVSHLFMFNGEFTYFRRIFMSTTMMVITGCLLVCFFALMICVGIYTRKHSTNVDGFVLGGRSVWNILFLCGYIRWICRTVRMELRYGFNLDRPRKRIYRFASRMECFGQKNKDNDSAPRYQNDARVF